MQVSMVLVDFAKYFNLNSFYYLRLSLLLIETPDRGTSGDPGRRGPTGEPGSPGQNGSNGFKGEQGIPGTSLDGYPGDRGDNGLPGLLGKVSSYFIILCLNYNYKKMQPHQIFNHYLTSGPSKMVLNNLYEVKCLKKCLIDKIWRATSCVNAKLI